MPCPHVTGVRYHVYRIEIIELVADISDLKYPLFYLIGKQSQSDYSLLDKGVDADLSALFQFYNKTGWHHDQHRPW